MSSSPIILALDFESEHKALALVAKLSPTQCRLKVGLELFCAAGPQILGKLSDLGFEVFLDLKFHDIPTTVEKAVKACLNYPVWMLNIHALGGLQMMKRVRERVPPATKLIAVTLLTSLSAEEWHMFGFGQSLEQTVLKLAKLAEQAGCDGIVCSALDIPAIKPYLPINFEYITPGIRTDITLSHDQNRIMSPKAALQAGSNYLVVGRSITEHPHPKTALETILAEIHS